MLKSTMISSYPLEYFELYKMAKPGFTFRQWYNRVETISKHMGDLNTRNKFKGDMLEVFAEIFFTIFQSDEGLGITQYNPIDINDDYGVDAVGVNVNGHNVAIQVKYRSNPQELITYADIAKTYTSALMQFNLNDVAKYNKTLYLFTNSNGVTGAFTKVMQQKVVIINKGVITTKIDNNKTFWLKAYDMIFNALNT